MKKIILLTLFTVLSFVDSNAQKINFWTPVNENVTAVSKTAKRESFPLNFNLYTLNIEAFKAALVAAPDRVLSKEGVIISLPNSQNEMERFELFEASNFEPELQAQYPEIRAYVGIGIDDKKAQLRMSIDPKGVQAMIFRAGKKTEFIEPYAENGLIYASYESARHKGKMPFTCSTADHSISNRLFEGLDNQDVMANNSVLKTFRLALSCTGEYGAYHGGTVPGALAAMNATMTRVNGVFEKDLAVRLNIIANNNLVIYTNAATDPYTGNLNNQLQNNLTTLIGDANYDIGHLFTRAANNGNAGCIGCVCNAGKGSAFTAATDPTGDTFDIDYVAHEMGHQLGAYHTFSEDFEGTGVNVEPGSGSTIMAYAGIMNNNVQSNSDDYFTYRSILQIQNNLANKPCANNITLSNPALTITAGGNWTIPNGTAFILTGANPTNNPGATFTWEQNNSSTGNPDTDSGEFSICYPTKPTGPNFRSLPPVGTPVRFMPAFSSVLNNNLSSTWESVSSIGRSMSFTLTARDNIANGGQTNTATANITVSATVGPFAVTSQSTSGVSWNQGSTQTIAWVVNNTSTLPGSANVDILLSTDGGLTFPTVLAANTPNDGSETITVPNLAAVNCRLMIRPTGNIYYAVNSTPFAIGYTVTFACNTYSGTSLPIITATGVPANQIGTINVPITGEINSVSVFNTITHTYLSDVITDISSPQNPTNFVRVYNRLCGETNGTLNLKFMNSGGPINCTAGAATLQTLQSADSFSVFNGQNPQGIWRLRVYDTFPGDNGTLNSWSIEICTQTATLSTENFGFDNFAIYPNPNKGNFTVSFGNPSDETVTIAVMDMRGRKIFEKNYQSGSTFNQEIQLENAQTGVYLLNLTNGDRKEVKRIIVE